MAAPIRLHIDHIFWQIVSSSTPAGIHVFSTHSRGLNFVAERRIPVSYKGHPLSGCYRIDLIVEDAVIVEIRSVEHVLPVHCAQVLSYLRLTSKAVSLFINFNVSYLMKGFKRVVDEF
jgi:GxxExxY protein